MYLFSFYNNKYMKMENELSDIKINIPINNSLSNMNNIQYLPNNQNTQDTQDTHHLYNVNTKIKTTKEDYENREKFYKKTPNTKIQILAQEIYLNRKNIIKNTERSTNKQYKVNIKSMPINTSFEQNEISQAFKNNERIFGSIHIPNRTIDKTFIENTLNNSSFSSINKLNKLYYPYNENKEFYLGNSGEQTDNINKIRKENDIESTNTENTDISPIVSTDSHITDNKHKSNCETENTSPDLTDSTTDSTESISSNEPTKTYEFRDKHFKEPKKRHYRRFKIKKKNIGEITDNNINSINESDYNDDLSQSDCSPRTLDTSLWNDNIENYYIEFQKICIEESIKYKQLNYRHEFISNFLKFILLLSSCFTFTLSLSSPSSVFFQVSTTITSILTTIITSVISFFTFEKRSEIEYYIYKGLDKINQNISIELIKPPQIRCDPYGLILTLQNQRDELLKKIHKKI